MQKYKHSEEELTNLRREEYESSVRVYALVDLELGIPFAIKVHMTIDSLVHVSYCHTCCVGVCDHTHLILTGLLPSAQR